MSSNDEKIALYMEASRAAQLAWDREEHRSATAWLNNSTYAATLRHLHAVPPLKPNTGGTQTKTISEKAKHLPALEKVTSCPDWLDAIVTGHRPYFARTVPEDHAFPIHRCMITRSRRKPYRDSEVKEKMTDDFHLHTILDPAAAIAAAMRDEPICAGLAQGQNSTFSNLTVHTVVEDRRTHWVAAEDKRSQIFTTHDVEFRDYANHEKLPWPSRKQMDQAPSGIRIWIQLWGQMCEYNVDYAKLFSLAGVIYVRRSAPGSTSLIFSKTYANLDGDVERSACVILHAPNILAAFIHIFLPYSNKIGHLPAIYILNMGGGTSFVMMLSWVTSATARHTKKLATSRIFLIGYGLGQKLCTQFWKAQYAPKFIVPWTICLESYAADIAIVGRMRAGTPLPQRKVARERPTTLGT
ncbi:hypothetical protein DFH09DRAFT_1369631 [Mycena vulgaris]|nr:hypothetical protein DFH09DRAFT_1369631 [Mycena vulgaris]